MFSNRGWLLKVLVPLAAFAGLAADAAWRIGAKYPHFAVAVEKEVEYDGKEIWVAPSEIVDTAPDGLVVEARQTRLRLITDQRFPKGTHVMARGIFHKDRTLSVSEIHPTDHWLARRSGVYGISAVVLLFFSSTFLKRFRLTFRGIAPKIPPPSAANPAPASSETTETTLG